MDYFRNFHGFGLKGTYLRHSGEEPAVAARRIISQHPGERVTLIYEEINDIDKFPLEMRFGHKEMTFRVPKSGKLNGILNYVITDNIVIYMEEPNPSLEIQKIVIGNQFVSELRAI